MTLYLHFILKYIYLLILKMIGLVESPKYLRAALITITQAVCFSFTRYMFMYLAQYYIGFAGFNLFDLIVKFVIFF